MNGRMKVMIAYDGSSYADDAIDDLPRAGLPRDAEILVVSVADLLASNNSPPVSEFDLHSLASRRVEAVLMRARAHRERVIEETKESAEKAADRLRSQFPEWRIESEALQGTPADELLQKAAEWKPDLIIVGSQGRSAIGRFFLGSVSKRVAEEAVCSVRVVRRGSGKTGDAPVKILAGANSLHTIERVILAIGRRVWSDETEVRLIAVDDGVTPGRVSSVYPDAMAIFEQAAEPLVAAGLQVSIDIRDGYLKFVLLKEAENCRADSIFVAGDKDDGSNEAAASLITEAKCTTEIAR